MMIVTLIMLLPTIAAWLLMIALKDSKKDKKRDQVYAEGIVVGYEDAGRFTGLTVRFPWNGTSVRCGSEQVDRFDFPEDSKVSIYYHPDIMKRPSISNHDRISGIVYINSPKYREMKQKSQRRTLIIMAVLATVLTLLTLTSFIVSILY